MIVPVTFLLCYYILQEIDKSVVKPGTIMSPSNPLSQPSPTYVALNHQTINKKRGMTGMKFQQRMVTEQHSLGYTDKDKQLQKSAVKKPAELKPMVVDPNQEPG